MPRPKQVYSFICSCCVASYCFLLLLLPASYYQLAVYILLLLMGTVVFVSCYLWLHAIWYCYALLEYLSDVVAKLHISMAEHILLFFPTKYSFQQSFFSYPFFLNILLIISNHEKYFLMLLSMHDCCIRVIYNRVTSLLEYINLLAVFLWAYVRKFSWFLFNWSIPIFAMKNTLSYGSQANHFSKISMIFSRIFLCF